MTHPEWTTVRDRLRERGHTVTTLGERWGIGSTAVSAMFARSPGRVTGERLTDIASLLDMTLDELATQLKIGEPR